MAELKQSLITKAEFDNLIFSTKSKRPGFVTDIEGIVWEDIRNVLHCMTKKYKNYKVCGILKIKMNLWIKQKVYGKVVFANL